MKPLRPKTVVVVSGLALVGPAALLASPAVSQVGGTLPAFVQLQPSFPGTTQTGSSSVSGVSSARQVMGSDDGVSPRLSVEGRTTTIGYGRPTIGVTQGNGWAYLMGSDETTFGHSLIWNAGAPMRFGAETALGLSGYQEYMRFAPNGNVGIGTQNPVNPLSVQGNADFVRGRVALFPNSEMGNLSVFDQNLRQLAYITGNAGEPGSGVVGVPAPGTGQARGAFLWRASEQRAAIFADVKNFVEPSRSDATKDYWYASLEGPEAAMYTRGRARLVGGKAVVTLPPHFVEMMAEGSDTVLLTPRGDSARGLWAGEIEGGRFVVREVGGGSRSYRFDWEVKAVRRGFEDYKVERPWTDRPANTPDRQRLWNERVQMLRSRGIEPQRSLP